MYYHRDMCTLLYAKYRCICRLNDACIYSGIYLLVWINWKQIKYHLKSITKETNEYKFWWFIRVTLNIIWIGRFMLLFVHQWELQERGTMSHQCTYFDVSNSICPLHQKCLGLPVDYTCTNMPTGHESFELKFSCLPN